MAIVPTDERRDRCLRNRPAQLILDTSGYFASGTAPAPTTYVLTVTPAGNGTGVVTSSDSKFNCPTVCAVSYTSGTSVTLSATPAPGNTFTGWSGGGCSGTGPCPLTLTAATTVTATFSGPSINLNPTSVGKNLETLAAGSLSLPVPSGTTLTVTATSSDPTKVLLRPFASDPSGTSQGAASFTGTVAAGNSVTPGFWIQALDQSGTAQITVSAPGYQQAVATITLTPSGFQLSGPAGTGANFTVPVGSNAPIAVSAVQLDNSGNVLATNQVMRGGASANVTVNSGSASTGTISGSPVTVGAGTTGGSVTFQPANPGTSILSITQPTGFMAPATGTQLTATVVLPAISLSSLTVGYNLQVAGMGQLNQAPSSTLNVTVSITSGSGVLLSTNRTAAGTPNPINLQVPAGSTLLPPFYIQATTNSGTVTLTATATGYSSGTATIGLTNSAFMLSQTGGTCCGAPFTTFATPPATPPATGLTVWVYQLGSSSQPLIPGQLRPGIPAVQVAVSSGTPSTGSIVGSPVTFNPGDSSNTSLSFQPNNCTTPCTTVLTVTQPAGFTTPSAGGQLTVTVNQPSVTFSMQVTTVGINLEVPATGALDAAVGQDLTVTITSSDKTKALLSTTATGAGRQSIQLTVPAGQGVNGIGFPTYYVIALKSSGTVTLTVSASAPFKSTSITVNLAPSGFVIDGGNGIGKSVGVLLGSNLNLTVSTYALDGSTLAPKYLEPLAGGLSASVAVTSNSGAGVISGSPVTIAGGSPTGTVTLNAKAKGTATVTVTKPTTPAGFSTPLSGNQLQVFID